MLTPTEADDRGQDRDRDGQGRVDRVTSGDRLQRVGELLERRATAIGHPEHACHLTHRDLDADAGQEADEDAARQEIGDESELEDAGQQEDDTAHEGGEAGQGGVFRRPGDRTGRDEAGREDRGGRRVRPDHEMPRRPEDGEEEDRQQQRVQARDHGHAGDLGVAHDLGDGQGGERRPGDDVDGDPGRVERQDPLEDRQRRLRLRLCRGCRHVQPLTAIVVPTAIGGAAFTAAS